VAPHVDPLPLVASAFVHVAQEGVREPWPLEVYDHDGVAHNVTTVPGDVVFYEGHSAIHGRPFPLNGSCFASVGESSLGARLLLRLRSARLASSDSLSRRLVSQSGTVVHFEPVAPLHSVGAELVDRHYPPYLLRGSSWEYEWRDEHPGGWELFRHPWELAERGDLEGLRLAADVDAGLLSQPNPETGWEPLLYACLRGHLDSAAFLVGEGGADPNAAYPGCPHFLSALHASNLKWGEDSAISRFLVSQGAVVDPLRQFNQSAPAEEDLYGL
jgi:prolyl 4-hydroxylase